MATFFQQWLSRRFMPKVIERDTFGYIANGLVFHLDGISKGGEAGKWKNLAGASVFTLPASFIEEANAVVTPGGTGAQNSAYPSVTTDIGRDDGTIEVCCEVLQSGSGCIIAAPKGYLCFIVAGAGYTYDANGANGNQWNVTKTNIFTASASSTRFAYNGAITGTKAVNGWGGASERIGNMGSSYGINARIYSIRKYNRVLSEYEVLRNQWIDDNRFSLGLNIQAPVPPAYRRLTGIVFDGNVWYDTGMPLLGSDTVKISFSATKACNVFGCYTSGDAQDNYSLYVSTTSSGKYMRYNGGTYSSYIATNTRYDVTITPTGTDGMRTDSTWTAQTFTCPTDMLIGSTSVGATSAKFTGTLYGELEVVGRAIFIPVERVADGEIGYYNPVTDEFLTNESTGTPTALGYA